MEGTRLQILQLLQREKQTVGGLANVMDLAPAAISRHLDLLPRHPPPHRGRRTRPGGHHQSLPGACPAGPTGGGAPRQPAARGPSGRGLEPARRLLGNRRGALRPPLAPARLHRPGRQQHLAGAQADLPGAPRADDRRHRGPLAASAHRPIKRSRCTIRAHPPRAPHSPPRTCPPNPPPSYGSTKTPRCTPPLGSKAFLVDLNESANRPGISRSYQGR